MYPGIFISHYMLEIVPFLHTEKCLLCQYYFLFCSQAIQSPADRNWICFQPFPITHKKSDEQLYTYHFISRWTVFLWSRVPEVPTTASKGFRCFKFKGWCQIDHDRVCNHLYFLWQCMWVLVFPPLGQQSPFQTSWGYSSRGCWHSLLGVSFTLAPCLLCGRFAGWGVLTRDLPTPV